MASTRTHTQDVEIQPYTTFHVEVARTERLSPNFLRVTFTGDALDRFADNGADQRIKLVVPLPGTGLADFPDGPDWYGRWRALPDERRNPLRTYTVRAVRQDLRELDVDFVLHGDGGPASRWANAARPGTPAAVVGPDARHPGPHGGREWTPPPDASRLLLAGDETAVPAICAIAESLSGDVPATILLEVPQAEDILDLRTRPGVEITWLPRDGAAHGDALIPAVREATGAPARTMASNPATNPAVNPAVNPAETGDLNDIDVDRDLLWEVPDPTAAAACDGLYAWLAGEAAMVKTLRRHLVQQVGVDRRAVAFMGYWRLGRAEAN
ncbi:siderophore-interacting protein [Thermopolyspora sp. NPDC052614]|uniref:siderophore-interacting protein n=1 Tax=Thermopolyspora sp. NPDC052614 TaxID=3155682 RepID=UPI00342BD666